MRSSNPLRILAIGQRTTTPAPLLPLLLRQAAGHVEHYRTDITKHDRRTLALACSGDRFLWVARQCGSILAQLGAGPETGGAVWARLQLEEPRPPKGRPARYRAYVIDCAGPGLGRLRRLGLDRALDMLAEPARDRDTKSRARIADEWTARGWHTDAGMDAETADERAEVERAETIAAGLALATTTEGPTHAS